MIARLARARPGRRTLMLTGAAAVAAMLVLLLHPAPAMADSNPLQDAWNWFKDGGFTAMALRWFVAPPPLDSSSVLDARSEVITFAFAGLTLGFTVNLIRHWTTGLWRLDGGGGILRGLTSGILVALAIAAWPFISHETL